MTQPRLSWCQKRLIRAALSFGAATAKELAAWSGRNRNAIYTIALRQSWPVSGKRYKYHAAYQDCWLRP